MCPDYPPRASGRAFGAATAPLRSTALLGSSANAWITVHLIRYTSDGLPVLLHSLDYPAEKLELAKAKARAIVESGLSDPHIQEARVVDALGVTLEAFRGAATV
jgi:hypothetical protein